MTKKKRTITCGWCYQTGHNIRGCKKYKDYCEKNNATPKMLQPRRCSYCGQTGHDKRKCGELEDDKTELILKNKKWIELILDDLMKAGVGVGAVLKTPNPFFAGSFMVSVVTGFKWENLFIKYPTKGWIKVRNFQGDSQNASALFTHRVENGLLAFRDCHCPKDPKCFWKDVELSGSASTNRSIKVISKVKQDIYKKIPAKILNGGHGVGDWFKDRKSANFGKNTWDLFTNT